MPLAQVRWPGTRRGGRAGRLRSTERPASPLALETTSPQLHPGARWLVPPSLHVWHSSPASPDQMSWDFRPGAASSVTHTA